MKKIIIIGAGISGLSLAYFLQRKGFDNILVLERDDKFDSDRQGFSLTMQNNTKNIFQEHKLLEEVYALGCRPTRQIFYDHLGNILYENHNNNDNWFNCPLPRQELRRIFYSKLKDNTVIFNTKVTNIKIDSDKAILSTNDKEYIVDYVIACDGINSICRKLFLPQVVCNDLSLCNVYGITDLSLVNDLTKEMFHLSTIQVLDGEHRFFSKPFDKNKQMWEITWPESEIYKKYEQCINVQQESLVICQNIVKSWPNLSWLHDFMNCTLAKDIIVHPLFDIDPTDIDFTNVPSNIIFIGDTIHPMSPYIGMGANTSIIDSYNLAKVFELPDFNKDFYKEVIDRSRKSVLRSRDNTKFYHTIDAIDKEKLWKFKNW